MPVYLAQITDVTEALNQLAGKDIAVLLAIALVVFGAVAWRLLGSFERTSRSVEKMATALHVKADAETKQTEAITTLVATNQKRTEVADKAYQEIAATHATVVELANKLQTVDDLHDVVNELRTVGTELHAVGTELLTIARTFEASYKAKLEK